MITRTSQQHQVSFQSIKPTIKIGEKAIREFKKEFPGLISPTRTKVRLYNVKDTIAPNLFLLLKNFIERKASIRYGLRGQHKWESLEENIKTTIKIIKESNIANCGEMTSIIQYNMLKKGIKTENVSLNLYSANEEIIHPIEEHVVLLMNRKKNVGCVELPLTWGNKAVIIDPWLGECKPANEMLERYKEIMNFKQETDFLHFHNNDYFNIDKYIKEHS